MKAYNFNACRKFRKAVFWIVVWGGSGFACQTLADEMPNNAAHRFDNWERASDSELDQIRGGFVLNGVNIDFSLLRTISLNGFEVSREYYELPGEGDFSLIQNGTGNQYETLSPDLAMSGLGSVIQNSKDGQIISTVNDINIAVSNLEKMDLNNSGMDFNNSMQPYYAH